MDEHSLFERWRRERRADIQREMRLNCQHVPFGQRIQTIRSILGMTQKQLASALGINARTVIRYERGQSAHPWLDQWVGLRELELAHAEEVFAYLESATANTPTNTPDAGTHH